ncbi:QRFP-like peptide receptor [Montipora capricornis]|uniref:QRFP-like peptide receptor n=1 Tax=Montipora capricornis TaxID=246305 RepID=UPI0035F1762C
MMDSNDTQLQFNFIIPNRSSTDVRQADPHISMSAQTTAEALAYVVIMFLSVFGNGLVLVVLKKNIGGQMRSTRNYLLTSMAAIDLLVTIGSMPERLTRALTNDQWLIEGFLGVTLCKVTNFFEKLSFSVSTLNIVLIAMDRFLAILFPLKKFFTIPRARVAIAMVWFSSALYCSPVLYYGGLLREQGRTLCKVRRFFPNWRAWYLVFLAQLLSSLILVLLLYAFIINKLLRRPSRYRTGLARADSLATNTSTREAKINRKVLKMVAAILIAFYVCFLPYWLGWVFCSYHYSKFICNDTYIFIAIYLSYANSSLNPLIYCAFSENFRNAFRLFVTKRCRPTGSGQKRRVAPQQSMGKEDQDL